VGLHVVPNRLCYNQIVDRLCVDARFLQDNDERSVLSMVGRSSWKLRAGTIVYAVQGGGGINILLFK